MPLSRSTRSVTLSSILRISGLGIDLNEHGQLSVEQSAAEIMFHTFQTPNAGLE